MTKTLEATFDGAVFRPDEPVELQPNTRVQIVVTVKPTPAATPKPAAPKEPTPITQ